MIVRIPEQGIIPAMRDDMIYCIGRDNKIAACADDAQRMLSEILFAVGAPSFGIPSLVRGLAALVLTALCLSLVLLAVRPGGDDAWTTGV